MVKATEKEKQRMKDYHNNNKEKIKIRKHLQYIKNRKPLYKFTSNLEKRIKINARRYAEKKPMKDKCEMLGCGETKNLQRHHWRYDKPLMVSTLCKDCHDIQHIRNFNASKFGRIALS